MYSCLRGTRKNRPIDDSRRPRQNWVPTLALSVRIREITSMSIATLCAVLMIPTALVLAEEMPLEVGSRKQLFIDRRFIAKSERVRLRTNPGQKLGQILDAD